MSLTVHLVLVFHIFIAVAIMVMVCGRHGIGPTIVLLYSIRTAEKGTWNVEKLSVNFAWNLTYFQKAPVKFCIFLSVLGWSAV